MAIGVFREIAFHPVTIAAPAVPSTIVLSDESPAVLSEAMGPAHLDKALAQLPQDYRRLEAA